MNPTDYPYHEDLEWLGVDRDGLIARFTTGGVGPIPKGVVVSWPKHRELQEEVNRLASGSDAEVLMKFGIPQDFKSCAERGLFAYDWSDVHRTTANSLLSYELMARPTKPLSMANMRALVPDFQRVLPRLSVSFLESLFVPISADVEWLHP